MKLVIVTAVQEFQKDVLKLFKQAQIESFSSSDIDGHKSAQNLLSTYSWFPAVSSGNESALFFSFTDEARIDELFGLIQDFNSNLETFNPIKAVVVPIEKFI